VVDGLFDGAVKWINSVVDRDTLVKWHDKHNLYHKYPSNKEEEFDLALCGLISHVLVEHSYADPEWLGTIQKESKAAPEVTGRVDTEETVLPFTEIDMDKVGNK
jgi:hypothetical protein